MTRTLRPLLVGLLGLAVLVGCSGAPGPAPTPTSSPTVAPSAPLPPAATPTITFAPCDGGFECATVPVPLDYAKPAGPTIGLAIVRRAAPDPTTRAGALLVNPGGPGGSGIDAVESGVVPAAAAERFDVIGFDPRGVGRSGALTCPVPAEDPYDGNPDPGDPAAEAATVRSVERYVDSCAQTNPTLLPHLGTRDVARDMDRIRAALGEERISYLGFSYGTAIGQVYGELFPGRTRTMLLDGVVDLTLPGTDLSQTLSFENSLRQYAASCAADPSCPVRPDPIAVVERVRARLSAAPLPVVGDTPLSAGEFEIGVVVTLYSMDTWPVLGQALAAADAGDGRPMRRLAETYFSSSDNDVYYAVSCLDQAWPKDESTVVALARAVEPSVPHFPGNFLVSALTCADWPVPPDPLTPPSGAGFPPVLIVGTTNDPATPYRNSAALAARLPGSVLLTHEGDGHTIVGQGLPCVDAAAVRYLVDGVLPATGTIC